MREGGDSDALLMQRVQDGDTASLKLLYDRHSPGLSGFIERMLGSPAEAADIVHDIFVSLWDGSAQFRRDSSMRAWLYTIARNKAIDRLRRSGREVPREPDVNLPDIAADPEQVAQATQQRERVAACLDKLSDAHRRAVLFSFYEDFTYREIADIEGTSEGTIKSRIFHAKQLLMHCLTR
jgi:RNA polymerase sigma-70 factor (ECF subfamily)